MIIKTTRPRDAAGKVESPPTEEPTKQPPKRTCDACTQPVHQHSGRGRRALNERRLIARKKARLLAEAPHTSQLQLCLACLNFNLKQLDNTGLRPNPVSSSQDATVRSLKLVQQHQEGNCKFGVLETNSPAYAHIEARIKETLSTIELVRIEHNLNQALLDLYLARKRELTDGTADSSPPNFKFSRNEHSLNENYMFHGSNNQNYDNIMQTGFDIKYSRSTGLLGQGIYFAVNASYSTTYTYNINTNTGGVKVMLLCRVMLGRSCHGTNLKTGCQSTEGTDIFAVFHNHQCYPEFIIYYKEPCSNILLG